MWATQLNLFSPPKSRLFNIGVEAVMSPEIKTDGCVRHRCYELRRDYTGIICFALIVSLRAQVHNSHILSRNLGYITTILNPST